MKNETLRKAIRLEIKRALNEAPAGSFLGQVGSRVRSSLGGRGRQLDRILSMIPTDRLARLPKNTKVDLLVALMQNMGISSRDFNVIKQRAGRALAGAESSATNMPMENVNEEDDANLGSLTTRAEKMASTSAFQSMKKAVTAAPSAKQADFAMNLLKGLDLDDAAKRKLRMTIKQL